MKILVATCPERTSDYHIHVYHAKCSNDMVYDVQRAFKALKLEWQNDIIECIAYEVACGRNYWYDDRICFECIRIEAESEVK